MKPLLHIHSLTKNYGATTALDSIELFIEPGSALAVLGPNGAGKSTLFGCLLGFTLASAGEIFFEDRPLRASDRL
ncbi:MAG TPA: ATP-binding cassette domain-containing protein, partial [Patescibacteria group bacterium]|nr:ATP-binding cassette domain-containing protein [Patescibacteria group bacterium]